MIRKILSFPFSLLASVSAGLAAVFGVVSALVSGKSLKEVTKKMEQVGVGLEATVNEGDAIIELVELHYGSGKAIQVADILNEDMVEKE